MFEGFPLGYVIGDLEKKSMMMCCNMILINENYGVDDELGRFSH